MKTNLKRVFICKYRGKQNAAIGVYPTLLAQEISQEN